MTHERFRHDMRRGLGSCQLALERCGNIEAYREDILWGLTHALAYDAQSEGTRAIYLFEMIERFDDWSAFYDVAFAEAKRAAPKDTRWRFEHFVDLLAQMAWAGYAPARQAIEAICDSLLHAISRGRPSKSGIWPALDNFSHLCVTVLTTVLKTREEQEAFYLRVLAEYGKILARRPNLGLRCEDEWFEAVAEEAIGEVRIHELMAQKGSDPDIAHYLENRDRLAAEQDARRAQARQQAKDETAQSIYEKLTAGEEPGRDFPFPLLRRMEKEHGREEIAKLAVLYAREEQASIRESILRLFLNDSLISTFEGNGISRLIRDAEGDRKGLRREALRVLGDARGDEVRAYALSRLKRRPKDVHAVYMLITNFRQGDGPRLADLVKSVSLDEQRGHWHGVFRQVQKLIERDKEADRELSEPLLPYMLREDYCSFCRYHILELMQGRGLLTPELIEECRRDCRMDIREFIETC